MNQFLRSWQALGWAALIALIAIVITQGRNLLSIKAASVEVTFEQRAKDLNVFSTTAFQNVKNLNEDQLKLFLIMGGDDAKFYRFTNTALSGDAARDQWKTLVEDSLVTIVQKHDTSMVYPTDNGVRLHRALIQSVYTQLLK